MKVRNVHPKLKDFLFPKELRLYDQEGRLKAVDKAMEGREMDGRQLLSWLECQEMAGRKWVVIDNSHPLDISGLIKHLRVAIQLEWIEGGPYAGD